MRMLTLAAGLLSLAANLAAAEAPEKVKDGFELNYKAAVQAVTEKDWPTAEVMFEAALKALGEADHPNKLAAQTLFAKAQGINKKNKEIRDTLRAADEMLKLKQWPEAKELYAKAGELGAPQEAVQKGLALAESGAKGGDAKPPADPAKPATPATEAPAAGKSYDQYVKDGLGKLEKKDFRAAKDDFEAALKLKPGDAVAATGLKEAERGLGVTSAPAPEKPAAPETPAAAAAIPLPQPVALVREEWDQGAGSATLWAGELLHLNEGDEKFRRVLKGDFAASVAIEARMDEQSMIYLDLRPEKKSGKKYPILHGYGSKAGSAPFLQVDKETAGKGDAQPRNRQITLSFRRTGGRIEFFCDGVKIAESDAIPADVPVWLWCCGKGEMNGAKVEGGK
ncbi:MAG: hypothetical protein KIS92_02250 [Planctomycetota bacterium]|nr:hypothetical protein [Planctomycetota bacterium]